MGYHQGMKRIDLIFVVILCLIAAAAAIHMTVNYFAVLNSTTSAPAWVGLLVGIPYLAASLLTGTIWLTVFFCRRHCNRRRDVV